LGFVHFTHVRGKLRRKFNRHGWRYAQCHEPAAAVFDPKVVRFAGVGEQVIAQVGGTGPVEMLPTRGAQSVFVVDAQAEGFHVIAEDIAAGGNAVTQCAVEVEEDGFDRGHENIIS
jgi:hypothetical protein